jgi:Fe-S cluster assembly protein SufD
MANIYDLEDEFIKQNLASKAFIIEESGFFYQKKIFTSKLKVILKKNVKADFYQIFDTPQSLEVLDLEIELAQNSSLKLITLIKTDQNLNLNYCFNLSAQNSTLNSYSLFKQFNKSNINYSLQSNHLSKNTTSNILHKTILNDQSQSSFLGRIVVENKAINSDSKLYNKNLLISPKTKIITKPELVIKCSKTRCNHGATSQQIDEDKLDYLSSKGLNQIDSKELLIKSFSQEIYNQIDPICFSLLF